MQVRNHPLAGDTPGTQRGLVSRHFGEAGAGVKVYLQAGLHADEVPGQLVLWHLIDSLRALESERRLRGEIVVVPCANPIGLSQALLWERVGRFEMQSGENFNRNYPDLKQGVSERVQGRLGPDAAVNQALIRKALREVLAEQTPASELAALRQKLLELAVDSDVVLDLHCDHEALVHIYTTSAGEPLAAGLARYVGAPLLLIADDSGVQCFDESCSTVWDSLRARYGAQHPVPAACFAATVELRGQSDVSDEIARQDAAHLLAWLIQAGAIAGDPIAPTFPAAQSTPLAGNEEIKAPIGGVVSYRVRVGDRVRPGDPIADIVDPVSGERVTICTGNEGLVYARKQQRFARRGSTVALVSGKVARRSGNLLCA